jgi:hypothetical protein
MIKGPLGRMSASNIARKQEFAEYADAIAGLLVWLSAIKEDLRPISKESHCERAVEVQNWYSVLLGETLDHTSI